MGLAPKYFDLDGFRHLKLLNPKLPIFRSLYPLDLRLGNSFVKTVAAVSGSVLKLKGKNHVGT